MRDWVIVDDIKYRPPLSQAKWRPVFDVIVDVTIDQTKLSSKLRQRPFTVRFHRCIILIIVYYIGSIVYYTGSWV